MAIVDKEVMLGLSPGADKVSLENAGALESQLVALEDRLHELPAGCDPLEEAAIRLQVGRVLVGLERGEQAWETARPCFDVLLAAGEWEQVVEVCDILFLAGQPGSLSALGQGIWLAVTYPIDPELTLAMLHHVVDETPADADGAAVAAAAGAYVVDLRAGDGQRENLTFFANQILGAVARRHSGVESQAQFELWFRKVELDDPAKFLVRLRNVVDVLVQDDWWFDRDKLHKTLPVN